MVALHDGGEPIRSRASCPPESTRVTDTIAVITDADGRGHDITMVQRWPVKQAVRCYREKPRPSRVMETGVRAIDTFNPLAEGGTGFIPGAFRRGQDRAPARHFEAGRRRRDHHGGVRRARQRGGRNLQGVAPN